MGSLSDYSEDALLDHILMVSSLTQPSGIYMALSTADPLDDASGIAEPSGGGYARIAVNNWTPAASRGTQNEDIVTFAEARLSWGTITHFALYDALTGGNMLAHGSLSTSKVVGNGDSIYFAAGDVNILISAGGFSDVYANYVLDHLFKGTSLTVPSNIFVALATAATVDADTGSTITEPADGYARVAHIAWDAASGGATENTGVVTYAVASGVWASVTHFALIDDSGNMMLHGALDAAIAVGIGDAANWIDGALDITLG